MNKRYLLYFTAVISAFLIIAPGIAVAEDDNTYTNISASTAKEMLKHEDVFLIDVRVQNEFNAAHIKGAILIPVKKLGKTEPYFSEEVFMAEVEKNGITPDKSVIVYCLSGSRSMNASQHLTNNSYTVYNLQYGLQEWIDSGYSVVSTFVDILGVSDCVKNALNAQINHVFTLLEKGCDHEAKDQLNKTNCTVHKMENTNKIDHDQANYLKNETGFIRNMII